MLPKKQPSNSASCSNLTVPELDQSKTTVLIRWRLHIPVGATNMPSKSSLPGIALSLGWGLIDPSWCDTARSLRVFPCLPLRSIFIFAPSGAWPMRLRRMVG